MIEAWIINFKVLFLLNNFFFLDDSIVTSYNNGEGKFEPQPETPKCVSRAIRLLILTL